eukprot:gene14850-biopygen11942
MTELEEFDYSIQYIPGKANLKADTLSRNNAANAVQPDSMFEDKIYAAFDRNSNFLDQLRAGQSEDPIISRALQEHADHEPIDKGRLKRVHHQLQLSDGVLTKSGRPVVPPSLRKVVVSTYHNVAHFGAAKVYAALKKRFYWPILVIGHWLLAKGP